MDDLYELNVAYAQIMARSQLHGCISRQDATALEDIGHRLVAIAEHEHRAWSERTPDMAYRCT